MLFQVQQSHGYTISLTDRKKMLIILPNQAEWEHDSRRSWLMLECTDCTNHVFNLQLLISHGRFLLWKSFFFSKRCLKVCACVLYDHWVGVGENKITTERQARNHRRFWQNNASVFLSDSLTLVPTPPREPYVLPSQSHLKSSPCLLSMWVLGLTRRRIQYTCQNWICCLHKHHVFIKNN